MSAEKDPKHVFPFTGRAVDKYPFINEDGQYRYYLNERETPGRVFGGIQVWDEKNKTWLHISGSGKGFSTEEDGLIWVHSKLKAFSDNVAEASSKPTYGVQPGGALSQALRFAEDMSNQLLSMLKAKLRDLQEAPTLNQKMIVETERLIEDTRKRAEETRRLLREA